MGGQGCAAAARLSSCAVIEFSCSCSVATLVAIIEFVSVQLLIADELAAKAVPKLETMLA